MSSEERRADLGFVREFPQTCCEGVTRRDEFQPCEKPAVAARFDPEDGRPYPVCAHHARGDMVLLADLLSGVGVGKTENEASK